MFAKLGWLLVAAPLVAADPPPAKGPADLHGAWRLVTVESADGSVNLPDPRPGLVFQGDKVMYGGEEIARLTADAAATPKIIDLKFAPDRVYEGVYAIEKDSLKLCLNGRAEGVKERPDGFDLKDQPARRLLTLERIKAEEAGPGAGFVGVSLRNDPDKKEILVEATLDGSPAAKAGLKKGDVVLAIGGTGISDLKGAVNAVRKAKPKGDLAVRVRRGDKEQDVTVRVGLLPFTILAGLE